MLSPSREINMDRCSHSCTKIGWAGMDISVFLIQHESFSTFSFHRISYGLDTPSQSFENSQHITTFLHGDNSKLVLFIDPNEEGFVIIVEDSTTLRPVSFHSSNSQVGIPRHEKEVIIHKLLSN